MARRCCLPPLQRQRSDGHDDREWNRQRYLCKTCKYRFDDLTETVLAGHHQSTWILGSYLMGVNLSNRQIAHELGLCESDVQTEVLRQGIVAKVPEVVLRGDVEFDELYVVAGHKGNPEAVLAKGRAIAYEKSGRWFNTEEPLLRAKERTDAGSSAFRHPRSELIAPLPQEVEPAFNNRKLHMRLPWIKPCSMPGTWPTLAISRSSHPST